MNTFGRNFRISIFGESHADGVGVVIDGVPAGIPLCERDFDKDIRRRKGGGTGTTPRQEEDVPVIMCGVLGGHTTGAPLAIVFRNRDTRSSDYTLFKEIPRPGHADYVAGIKWHDFNDPRGGGHFSGRLTLPVVAAGVVAKKVLMHGQLAPQYVCAEKHDETADGKDDCKWHEVDVMASIASIGNVPRQQALSRAMRKSGPYSGEEAGAGPDADIGSGAPEQCHFSDYELWRPELDAVIADGDSIGGVVECSVTGLPAGLGEPFFDSVESLVSHAVFSIPGVRGIEFGDGFRAAAMRGSEHNDPIVSDTGKTSRNGSGGLNGGITNGNPLVFRVAFKPASSIRKEQHTYNFTEGRVAGLSIPGRHDACFAMRTPVIVEAMVSIVLADLKMLRI